MSNKLYLRLPSALVSRALRFCYPTRYAVSLTPKASSLFSFLSHPMHITALLLRTAALLLFVSAAACSSSKQDAAPAPTPARGMSWTADGTAQTTTTLQSQKF